MKQVRGDFLEHVHFLHKWIEERSEEGFKRRGIVEVILS
jgi:hypothetical protein